MQPNIKNYPKGLLLDVGCRDRKQHNFVGIDKVQHPGVDIVHDLEKFPYPVGTESCHTIKCAHVIEHIKPWNVIAFMDELWRMLIPDGQLAMSAPYAGSPGYTQDPTHCTMITEKTWQYFSHQAPMYQQYRPKPWAVEHLAFKVNGNIEVVLRKIKTDDRIVELTTEAIQKGALQKHTELYDFLNFIKDKPLKTVAEIGTYQGGVFYALCQLADPKATVISLDLVGGQFGGESGLRDVRHLATFGKKSQDLIFIRKDSHKQETKKEFKTALNGKKLDLLFIDGDHTYSGVKKDWEMYAPFVKAGGFVIFHDICFHPQVLACEVERFWNELMPTCKTLVMIDNNDRSWGGIGIVEIT